jgi:hypothetical protein
MYLHVCRKILRLTADPTRTRNRDHARTALAEHDGHAARKTPPRPRRSKHLKWVGDKEQAEELGRYCDRAEGVAARTVMKHHKREGHEKGE